MSGASAQLNLSRFDFTSIRLVVDCIRHGSLTAAARESHLAAAAASRRIRELEQAIGEPLFTRHGRGLQPTTAGRAFFRHGLELLHAMDQMRAELLHVQLGVARYVRLGASCSAITDFLPAVLDRYVRSTPNVRIELEEEVSEDVVKALREGRVDVGIFVEGQNVSGLDCSPVTQHDLVLLLPHGHRLAGSSAISFADTLDEDWISFTEGAALLKQQYQAAHAGGRLFRLRMQARSFDAVSHLVAAGLGIAMLPKTAAVPLARSMRLHWRPLADAWAQRRILVGIRSGTQDVEVQALASFLQRSRNANESGKKRQ